VSAARCLCSLVSRSALARHWHRGIASHQYHLKAQ
jgi:hypothetical protein